MTTYILRQNEMQGHKSSIFKGHLIESQLWPLNPSPMLRIKGVGLGLEAI